MNSIYVVILSPLPFTNGKEHDPEMIECFENLVVKGAPYKKRDQGDLFTGFARISYIIAVETMLEVLDRLPDGLKIMNYWLAFWVEEMITEFIVPLGLVREQTVEELHGI